MKSREIAFLAYVTIMHIALMAMVLIGNHKAGNAAVLFLVVAITPGALVILLVPLPRLPKLDSELKNQLLPLCFLIRDHQTRKNAIGDLTEEYKEFMLPQYGEAVARKWLRTQVWLTVVGELVKIVSLTILVDVVKKLVGKLQP